MATHTRSANLNRPNRKLDSTDSSEAPTLLTNLNCTPFRS